MVSTGVHALRHGPQCDKLWIRRAHLGYPTDAHLPLPKMINTSLEKLSVLALLSCHLSACHDSRAWPKSSCSDFCCKGRSTWTRPCQSTRSSPLQLPIPKTRVASDISSLEHTDRLLVPHIHRHSRRTPAHMFHDSRRCNHGAIFTLIEPT